MTKYKRLITFHVKWDVNTTLIRREGTVGYLGLCIVGVAHCISNIWLTTWRHLFIVKRLRATSKEHVLFCYREYLSDIKLTGSSSNATDVLITTRAGDISESMTTGSALANMFSFKHLGIINFAWSISCRRCDFLLVSSQNVTATSLITRLRDEQAAVGSAPAQRSFSSWAWSKF